MAKFYKMKYLVPIIFLLSCNAAKKAERDANKLLKNHPEVVLPIFRGAFPCTTLKVDTIYNWHDTTLWVECPNATVDTLEKVTKETIYSPVKVKKVISLQTMKLTEYIEDSAKIKALTIQITSLQTALSKSEAEAIKFKLRSRTYLVAFLILLIAFLISIFVNYIQAKK